MELGIDSCKNQKQKVVKKIDVNKYIYFENCIRFLDLCQKNSTNLTLNEWANHNDDVKELTDCYECEKGCTNYELHFVCVNNLAGSIGIVTAFEQQYSLSYDWNHIYTKSFTILSEWISFFFEYD